MLRRRLLLSAVIGSVVSIAAILLRAPFIDLPGDLYWPLCAARSLVLGLDPYGLQCVVLWEGHLYPSNPLTTAIAVLPFVALGNVAGPALFGVGSGLLTWGMLQERGWAGLLVFTGAPYWVAFWWLQWSPLLASLYFLPALAPLALIKPHIGASVLLAHPSWRSLVGCVFFGLLSLALDPTWPSRWWPQAQRYDGFSPLLVAPWLVLPLGLVLSRGWRDPRVRLLVALACVPQRGLYDLTLLWIVPRSARGLVTLSALSWVVFALWWIGSDQPFWIVALLYVPAIGSAMWAGREPHVAPASGHPAEA